MGRREGLTLSTPSTPEGHLTPPGSECALCNARESHMATRKKNGDLADLIAATFALLVPVVGAAVVVVPMWALFH